MWRIEAYSDPLLINVEETSQPERRGVPVDGEHGESHQDDDSNSESELAEKSESTADKSESNTEDLNSDGSNSNHFNSDHLNSDRSNSDISNSEQSNSGGASETQENQENMDSRGESNTDRTYLPSAMKWTKSNTPDLIIGNPDAKVRTRSATTIECLLQSFLSQFELKR